MLSERCSSWRLRSAARGGAWRASRHSDEVHALDLAADLIGELPANVTFHQGDSKVTLPALLAEFERDGRQVDFALVDGDHSLEGARADLSALLASTAVTSAVILAHDSFNPFVRAGLQQALAAFPGKATDVEIDFVSGRMTRSGPVAGQLWGGFALIIVDEDARLPQIRLALEDDRALEFHDAYETMDRGTRLLAEAFGSEANAPASHHSLP